MILNVTKNHLVGMGWMSHCWCVLFTSVFVSAFRKEFPYSFCLPNLNYFISITCSEDKVASGYGRTINPKPEATFIHAHSIDRTSHLQVGLFISLSGPPIVDKDGCLPFCFDIINIVLCGCTTSLKYFIQYC